MKPAWQGLKSELLRWKDAGREPAFWWRDDDATRLDPALARLTKLAAQAQVPLALAVIPMQAEAAAFEGLDAMVTVIQHGADHRNRAAAGAKKNEFPDSEPADASVARLAEGHRRLAGLAGARFLPVLAPPWNRLDERLVARLAEAGLRGLSRYGARASALPAPGLRQVNTHVDIIDWKGGSGGGFIGEEAALEAARAQLAARRERRVDAGEPVGWLTHHARHDRPAWDFLERLFEFTSEQGLPWRSGAQLFT